MQQATKNTMISYIFAVGGGTGIIWFVLGIINSNILMFSISIVLMGICITTYIKYIK